VAVRASWENLSANLSYGTAGGCFGHNLAFTCSIQVPAITFFRMTSHTIMLNHLTSTRYQ
jgi:hypothetical protein